MYGPDNKQIDDYDGELRPDRPEVIEYVPKTEGTYRLDIINKFPNLPAGKYQIGIVDLHPASDKEIIRQQARTLFAESVRLFNAGKYGDSKQAVEKALQIDKQERGSINRLVVDDLSKLARMALAARTGSRGVFYISESVSG